MSNSIFLTIVLCTWNRKYFLRRCLESIDVACAFVPNIEVETIVLINSGDSDSESIVSNFQNSSYVKIITVATLTTNKSALRNLGIKKSRGEFIYFIDDDVEISPYAISLIVEKVRSNKDIEVLGGPNLSKNRSSFEKAVDAVLTSYFGTAIVRNRYVRAKEDRDANDRKLILCNLVVRRNLFNTLGVLFNEHVVCNEENILLRELSSMGVKLYYSPDMFVYHYRRDSIFSFARQNFIYGYGRAQNIVVDPGYFHLPFLIPAIFVLYIVSLPYVMWTRRDYLTYVYIIPLLLYITLNILFSLFSLVRKRVGIKVAMTSFILFFTLHISYGAGLIIGMIGEAINKVIFSKRHINGTKELEINI